MTPHAHERQPRTPSAPRLMQPEAMKTESYVYGVEKLNGYDAWALFEACALGDVLKVKALLRKDRRLVNAQFWYQFPIHMAVRGGHAEIVKLLLERGADPGQSRYTYNSWDKLLLAASERGHRRVEALLQRAMRQRFNYSPAFEALKDAIVAGDARQIGAVLRRQPRLDRASDALGNNALHWSVLARQWRWLARFAALGTPLDGLRADGQTPVLLAVNGATDYWYRATRGKAHPSLRNASVLVGILLALGAHYTISVAAAVGDQQRVEELLARDAELARRLDTARVSPLSYAAREGHLHIVRLLLERGADPNAPEDLAADGRALFEACGANHLEIAKLLLAHGANPNAGLDSSGCCLTIGEVCHGTRAKPLQQLLRRHGAVSPPYAMSLWEIKQAICTGHQVVRHVEFPDNVLRRRSRELLDLYLDSDPAASDRLNFRSVVTYPKAPALVRGLLARGLDPNRRDWLGKTYLHACAESGPPSVAAVLLHGGADINARDFEFHGTPLAAAVRAGDDADPMQTERRRRMVEFLLAHSAATNLPDDPPWATPLAWATRRRHDDLVKLLKQHGAT